MENRATPADRDFARIVRRVERREHIGRALNAVAFGHLAGAALLGLGGASAFLLIAPWGWLSGDPLATWLLGGLGALVAGFFLTVAGLAGSVGLGLLGRRRWARAGGVLTAVLMLPLAPVGTLIGALSLAVLLQRDAAELLQG